LTCVPNLILSSLKHRRFQHAIPIEINVQNIGSRTVNYSSDMQGQVIMQIKKEPAFFETGFSITQERPMSDEETLRTVLGAFMMVLLERIRG